DTPRKPVSEKQLIANRMNSRLSTGPRTPEGKAKASMNNTSFGMRSSKAVLPGESQAEYDRLRDNAMIDLAPANETEAALVDRFARLEWRGMRGEAAEDGRASRRIREVVRGAEDRAATLAARLMRDLNKNLENAQELRRTPAGLRALIA